MILSAAGYVAFRITSLNTLLERSGDWVIRFLCHCGEEFKVREADQGRKATCPNCLTGLVVPGPNSDFAVVAANLPPRQKRRKPSEQQKPRLKKNIPDAFEPTFVEGKEMHPILVIVISVLLFMNGWQALQDLFYVPIVLSLQYSAGQSIEDVTDAELAYAGMTRTAINESIAYVLARWVPLVCAGLLKLGVAASLAGILTWRGYAVYYAVGFSVILWLVSILVRWDDQSLASMNLAGTIAIVLMLQKLSPITWPRLMNAATN